MKVFMQRIIGWLFLGFLILSAAVGIGVSSLLQDVQEELPVGTLEYHQFLAELIQHMTALNTRLDDMRLSGEATLLLDKVDEQIDAPLMLLADYETFLINRIEGSLHHDLKRVQKDLFFLKYKSRIYEKVSLEELKYISDRFNLVIEEILDLYIYSNDNVLKTVSQQQEQVMKLRKGLFFLVGLTVFAVIGIFLLFILRQKAAKAKQDAQRAMEKSEQRYRNLFHGSVQGIILSEHGKPLLANDRAADIFGFDTVEALLALESLDQLYADEYAVMARDYRIRRMSGDRTVPERYEFRAKRMDGSEIWIENHIKLTHWNDEVVIQSTLIDISKRKMIEHTLLEAKDAADAANRAKSDFLANMSHEIRTPMNAILGMVHLALKTDLSEKQQDYLRKLQSSAQSLLYIINDILDFSKIEAGKIEVEKAVFSVEDIISDVHSLFYEKAQEKGLIFTVNIDDIVPKEVIGDSFRLKQVLINLVGNAIKFTGNGYVSVHVKGSRTGEEGVQLDFSVEDTGIGLTETQKQRLFQSFAQADSSTTRKFGGTGLGLVISKSLIEIMGGNISVSSIKDKGSCFAFNIFCHIPKDNTLESKRFEFNRQNNMDYLDINKHQFLKGENLEGSLATLQNARILLVEDNEVNRQVACEIMEDAGLIVTNAGNGLEAVQRLQNDREQYEAILMDIQMPEMDGLEATRILRQNKHLTNVPIIAMTAHAMAQDKQKCLAAGMNDHVAKPIDPDILFKTLRQWVKPDPFRILDRSRHQSENLDLDHSSDAIKFPDHIPGINISLALRHCIGRHALLSKILLTFLEDYDQVGSEMMLWFEAHNWTAMSKKAHALKGVASTIGAERLYSVVAEMERSCQEHVCSQDQMAAFLEALNEVQAGIKQAELHTVLTGFKAKNKGFEGNTSLKSQSSVLDVLESLKTSLLSGDSEALDIVEDLSSLLVLNNPELLEELKAQIADFEYEMAMATLMEIYKSLES